jgi:hypothetical protein
MVRQSIVFFSGTVVSPEQPFSGDRKSKDVGGKGDH